MSVGGRYAILVKTPIGDQRGILTINPDGDGFSGSLSGSLGSQDIPSGTIDGDTVRWTMQVAKPMSLKLDCTVTIDGDTLSGTVKAGIFGSYPMTGTRSG
jgi:hypothetical protein